MECFKEGNIVDRNVSIVLCKGYGFYCRDTKFTANNACRIQVFTATWLLRSRSMLNDSLCQEKCWSGGNMTCQTNPGSATESRSSQSSTTIHNPQVSVSVMPNSVSAKSFSPFLKVCESTGFPPTLEYLEK